MLMKNFGKLVSNIFAVVIKNYCDEKPVDYTFSDHLNCLYSTSDIMFLL